MSENRKKKTKEKRVIPLRQAGETVQETSERPSKRLFDEVVRQEAAQLVNQNPDMVNQTVPPVVNHTPPEAVNQPHAALVNQSEEARLTETENPVNLLTKAPQKLTKNEQNTQNPVNKLTTAPQVVNHEDAKWLTTEPKRSRHSEVVEGFRTSREFKQKVKTFCAEQGIDKQDFYHLAVNHYFECVVNHPAENVVNKLTYDDIRLNISWKTKPAIINLYLRYNSIFNEKSKWTVKDDDAGSPFNEVDIRFIELGILQTQSNKGFTGKINSFNYYAQEIKNILQLPTPTESLDMMVQYYRSRWEQVTGRKLDLSFLQNGTEDNAVDKERTDL